MEGLEQILYFATSRTKLEVSETDTLTIPSNYLKPQKPHVTMAQSSPFVTTLYRDQEKDRFETFDVPFIFDIQVAYHKIN